MDNPLCLKTQADHQREMLAVVQQHLAVACAHCLCDPEDKKWPSVVIRLLDWQQRLEADEVRLHSH